MGQPGGIEGVDDGIGSTGIHALVQVDRQQFFFLGGPSWKQGGVERG